MLENDSEIKEDFFESIPTDGKGWFNNPPEGVEELPLKVYYSYLTDEQSRDSDDPTKYWIEVANVAKTPDLRLKYGGDLVPKETTYSLSIWINKENVPDKFKKFVFIHEMYEGFGKSHDEAVEVDRGYAKEHLSDKDYTEYEEWRESIRVY